MYSNDDKKTNDMQPSHLRTYDDIRVVKHNLLIKAATPAARQGRLKAESRSPR